MRFNQVILPMLVVLMLGWGLGATTASVKIGLVDVEEVLSSVESGKAAREELERKGREAEARLAPLIQEFEEMQKELQAKHFVMSEDAVRAKQLDMAELRNRIETKSNEEQGQLKVDQQRLIAPLMEKLGSVIDEVGRENGFSLILAADAPGILFKREALDMTSLVIKSFDGKS